VRDHNGQALAYAYAEDKRTGANSPATKRDGSRRTSPNSPTCYGRNDTIRIQAKLEREEIPHEAPLVDLALAVAIEPADCSVDEAGPNRNIWLASITDSWRNSHRLCHISLP
jgi:hypothetical protein